MIVPAKGCITFRRLRWLTNLHGSSFLYLRRSEQQALAPSLEFMIIRDSSAAAEMCLTAETDGAQAAGVGMMV